MRLNAERVDIHAADDDRKSIVVTGDPVRYGFDDDVDGFDEHGIVKEGDTLVLSQARVFVGTGRSTIDVFPTDAEPTVTPPEDPTIKARKRRSAAAKKAARARKQKSDGQTKVAAKK